MSTDRDVTGIVRSWLEEGATSLPERVLDDVLARVPTTPQRRAPWPAWRFHSMSSPFKIAMVAAGIGALALVSVDVLPRSPDIGAAPAPSSSPSPSPAPLHADTLPAGTYSVAPFAPPDEWTLCMEPPQPGCVETASDDAITFTFTVPEGWEGAPFKSIWLAGEQNASPSGAGLYFSRGGSLYSDPCLSPSSPPTPDIPVGPSVEEFADALADHPLLDVTTPVDVTLDGYAGRYLELRTPADISGCDPYLPWEPGLFAQPSRVWHLWILDVDGVRVVVTTTDYPGTSPEVQAQLQDIVDSIAIEPPPAPLHQGTLAAGTYTVAPFAGDAWAPCGPAETSCPEAARDDAIRFTFTVPEGWAGAPFGSDIWLADEHNSGPDGAGFLIGRGGWLYSEPCGTSDDPDVPVGPTVDDLIDAVMDHPQVVATKPVATEFGGRPATYFEVQGPADLADCPEFMIWAPSFYAQGPGNRWLVWVVDVEGVRVVITGSEFPETTTERSAELGRILQSMRIDIVGAPSVAHSPVPDGSGPTSVTSVADRFTRPFEYTVPTGMVVTKASPWMYGFTEGSSDTYPGFGYEDVRDVRGVTVSIGIPARTPRASRQALPLRPEAFFEDLRGNPALFVGPVTSAMVGGVAAQQADVRGGEGWGNSYPELRMQDEGAALNFPGSLTVAEIDGGSLVVHIWAATEEELAVWRPIAAGIIESIRFIEPSPDPR